jgi:hypothetical protein
MKLAYPVFTPHGQKIKCAKRRGFIRLDVAVSNLIRYDFLMASDNARGDSMGKGGTDGLGIVTLSNDRRDKTLNQFQITPLW